MRATYLLVLGACLLLTLPLELRLGARVYRRPLRWALAVLPVAVAFLAWDLWAVWRGDWAFDPAQTIGVELMLPLTNLPVEEVLFFLVIPTCALLTFEAVRRVTGWRAGDEP